MQPNLTWNPLDQASTITAYIVQVSLGDLPHACLEYQTIFAARAAIPLGVTSALVTNPELILFDEPVRLAEKKTAQSYPLVPVKTSLKLSTLLNIPRNSFLEFGD